MSTWGGVDATFYGGKAKGAASMWPDHVGSEGGPDTAGTDDEPWIHGRLRDVSDERDSPAVLAWFVYMVDLCWPDRAELTWEIDNGPRYRWTWTRDDGLRRLNGVLDG